ncbi:EAL domain-containing protein [Alteromonas sp. C1M14]|uniref:EAL domain-containing protein n=1 Tax=Alteromonas sp. C1M14 TaxID=2841567 RepID=UPI001C0A421B|nr:EAL domain-containing protein [Alteromonas sp. C1M14]MBU2977155.1 EAL domain-containing protein [Alteromonas sp. C1M14]
MIANLVSYPLTRLIIYFGLLASLLFPEAYGKPRIEDPAFLQLGTDAGLAQDNVQDIVRDRDGFVWVATEGGLSRFDGYRFITIPGPDDLFVNNAITNLFVDSHNRLWVSTYNEGIFFYDLDKNAYSHVARIHYQDQPEWIQSSDAFEELPNGDVVVAMEQEIIRVDPTTGKHSVLYRLGNEDIADSHIIRDILVIKEHLLIATSKGVEILSLTHPSDPPKPLPYLPPGSENLLNINAKVLFAPAPDLLLIGTVGGLYQVSLERVLSPASVQQPPQGKVVLPERNIWVLRQGDKNNYWLGTDKGLFKLSGTNGRWQYEHVLYPTTGLVELADKTIRTLLPDEQGNLWLGSVYGGLLFWYAQPLGIETVQNTIRDDKRVLTDNTVWSFYQEDGDTLWVGTENGLTKYQLSNGASSLFLYQQDMAERDEIISIQAIYPADDDHLILETYQGLRLFNKSSGMLSPLPVADDFSRDVFLDWNFGSAADEQGRIYFLADDFYRYDYHTEKVEQVPLESLGYNAQFADGFLGTSSHYPGEIFLALRNALVMINTQTFAVRQVFKFSSEQRSYLQSVSSFVVDDTNTLWLGFPSYGLMGVDADTFAPKVHYTANSRLESDIVYSLTADDSGQLWFSSHGYFSLLDPLTDSTRTFKSGEDIRVSEFNDGAVYRLDDGRLVFGATSGLIIFDPTYLTAQALKRAQNVKKMAISGVSLESRRLKQPMRNLSGEHMDFRSDDYGITIRFSALSPSYGRNTAFRYKLVHEDTVVSESLTKRGGVTFAFLAPGKYHFEVAPLKQANDVLLLPAMLSFTIPYPPLRSPLAYTLYGALALILTGAYLYHRQRQLTRLQQAQQEVRLFGNAFQHTRDWVMIFNSELVPVAANPACCQVFGLENDKRLHRQLQRLFENSPKLGQRLKDKLTSLTAGDFWKSEERLIGTDGKHYDILVELSAAQALSDDSEPEHYLLVMSDISDQKYAERKLIKIANYDSLTGLVNRTLLLERLELAIAQGDNTVAVLFVDLDRFKGINDSLGHDYGDQLLRIVANRMLNLANTTDTVSRLGGDEFVIVLEKIKNKRVVREFVDALIKAVETPISLGSEIVRVSASVGVSFYPDDAQEPAELLKQADVAMYTAKKDVVYGFSYYTEEMDDKVRRRLSLENRVKRAYQEHSFFNHYQPIVNVITGDTAGLELLLRCHLSSPPLYPSEFIPVLEELRYIIDITRDAMKRAVIDLQSWYSTGFRGYVAVNLSALHFKMEFDVDGVIAMLDEAGLPRSAMRFELTESVLMDDTGATLRQINRFLEAGFLLALDDFGTGYSSLSYLKVFPLNIIKIDKSFVDDINPEHDNDALVMTTINLATNLDMGCIAEGVETQVQADYLKANGCYLHQGYLYSRPVAADQVPHLLTKTWSTHSADD